VAESGILRREGFVDDAFVDTVARHFGEAARLAAELGPLAEAPDDLAERALRAAVTWWNVERSPR
jgi:hypothetical protein